jgi:hypothetical protein
VCDAQQAYPINLDTVQEFLVSFPDASTDKQLGVALGFLILILNASTLGGLDIPQEFLVVIDASSDRYLDAAHKASAGTSRPLQS